MNRIGYVVTEDFNHYHVQYCRMPERWVLHIGENLNVTRHFTSYGAAVAYAERFFLHRKSREFWIYVGNMTSLLHINMTWRTLIRTYARQYKTERVYTIARHNRYRAKARRRHH